MKKFIKFIFNFKEKEEIFRTMRLTMGQNIKWHAARGVRNTSIFALFLATGWVSAVTYNKLHPVTVYAEKETIVMVVSTSTPPVMERIAKCESGKSQYAKDGQVLMKVNANGTVDAGYYQINSVWRAQATKLGFDLTKENDNKAFAMWLYQNEGTEAWYSSESCWSK